MNKCYLEEDLDTRTKRINDICVTHFSWIKYRRNAKYEEALEKFEFVLRTKPEPEQAAVTNYDVASYYSKLNWVYMFAQFTNYM